jgi:hypothetical protein
MAHKVYRCHGITILFDGQTHGILSFQYEFSSLKPLTSELIVFTPVGLANAIIILPQRGPFLVIVPPTEAPLFTWTYLRLNIKKITSSAQHSVTLKTFP